MNGKTGKTVRRIGALALSAVMGVALVPSLQGAPEVKADTGTKDKTNTWIGQWALQNPKQPTSKNDPWTGDYVYYGKHDGQPVLFRALNNYEQKFEYDSVFLECDSVLCNRAFDDEKGSWNADGCDIRSALSGDSILELTTAEKSAVTNSQIKEHALSGIDNKVISRFGSYVANNDDVFLMDVEDVLNKQYGYWNESGMGQTNTSIVSRQKKEFGKSNGEPVAWSLRNTVASDNTRNGIVGRNGTIGDLSCQTECGISPAITIRADEILFSTLVDGTKGEPGAKYKLTVFDYEIYLEKPSGKQITFNGNTITVPFKVAGAHADSVNRISLLITDKSMATSSQYRQGTTILEYRELPVTGTMSNGTVSFSIPDNLGVMDEDFFVYIVPECVNGKYETDYYGCTETIRPSQSVMYDLTNGDITEDMMLTGIFAILESMDSLIHTNDSMHNYYDLDKDGNADLIDFFTSGGNRIFTRAETCSIYGTYKYEIELLVTEYISVTSVTFKFPLYKPTITKAEPTDNGVQVKWSKVSGYSSYNVYRSTSENGTYSYLASVTGGTTKYVDKTAQGGKTYYYKVRPYKKTDGKTSYATWSDAAKVVVLGDTKLTAEPKSGVTMKLSWTAVSGATSYEIYRATSASGPYTYVKATTGTSTSDTGLTAGTRYYYMVRAKKTVNGVAQYSKYSAAVAVALATPSMESATFTSGKGVTLKWTKASGADRYNVYKYNTSTGKYDYVASVLGGTLTYTDANGKKGDYYKVRAYKRVDGVVYYGGWSNAKAGK